MNCYIFLLVVFSSTFHVNEKACDKLIQGKYIATIDKQFKDTHGSFQLTINDTTVTTKIGFLTDVYKIQKIKECNFWFTKPYTVDTSNMAELNKQISSLGQPYYDIQFINTDTLRFVYRHNPHIMINSGILVKVK